MVTTSRPKNRHRLVLLVALALAACTVPEDPATLAIVHATVIDGTGAQSVDDRTLIVRDGYIVEIGPSASVEPPRVPSFLWTEVR